jgi:hypothetical protein
VVARLEFGANGVVAGAVVDTKSTSRVYAVAKEAIVRQTDLWHTRTHRAGWKEGKEKWLRVKRPFFRKQEA